MSSRDLFMENILFIYQPFFSAWTTKPIMMRVRTGSIFSSHHVWLWRCIFNLRTLTSLILLCWRKISLCWKKFQLMPNQGISIVLFRQIYSELLSRSQTDAFARHPSPGPSFHNVLWYSLTFICSGPCILSRIYSYAQRGEAICGANCRGEGAKCGANYRVEGTNYRGDAVTYWGQGWLDCRNKGII